MELARQLERSGATETEMKMTIIEAVEYAKSHPGAIFVNGNNTWKAKSLIEAYETGEIGDGSPITFNMYNSVSEMEFALAREVSEDHEIIELLERVMWGFQSGLHRLCFIGYPGATNPQTIKILQSTLDDMVARGVIIERPAFAEYGDFLYFSPQWYKAEGERLARKP